MSYATRAQLLARANVLRVAQLAVPTSSGVMPDAAQVQAALLGDASGGVDMATAQALQDAVAAVDTALGDAADLMRSYSVPAPESWTGADPAQPVPQALVRINCQLAMHYLAERAGMLAESDSANYNALLKLLGKHASGEVALAPTPVVEPGTTPAADVAHISSGASRYGRSDGRTDDDDAGWAL